MAILSLMLFLKELAFSKHPLQRHFDYGYGWHITNDKKGKVYHTQETGQKLLILDVPFKRRSCHYF
jgi:hypothetical protein